MIDPWRYVDADDDLVADLLAGTVEIVLELGGWLHPQARIVARDGQVHLECEAPDSEPLIGIPAQAFVPVGRVEWSDSAERLDIVDVGGDLTAAAHELLILQRALHNACGKVMWLVRTHPVLAPDLTDQVIDAVRAFRPSFRLRQPSPASLLWSDRVFRLPVAVGGAVEPVAVPIVDLLDHRSGGATPTWTGGAFTVDVHHAGDTSSTWLDYGLQRDAIGMAVVYGFADGSNPRAHSAPVEVEVPGRGPVRVLARGRSRDGALLRPVVTRDDDGTVVSHLVFGPQQDPVAALMAATDWDATTADAVTHGVAARNIDLADDLIAAARADGSEAALTLADAAEHHRSLLAPFAG